MARPEFRGHDRDILRAFGERDKMINDRDAFAAAGVVKPNMSNTIMIVPPEETRISGIMLALRNHVQTLYDLKKV